VTTADRSFVQNYTPAKSPANDFKASIRLAAARVYNGSPIEGPLAVRMLWLFPRPGRLRWKTKPMPRCFHDSRPDAENVAKAVLDALTGLLWCDDSQVCDLRIKKMYAAGEEPAGVYFETERL
jgi:Holliday junction resolvase RusA-like endonuclease